MDVSIHHRNIQALATEMYQVKSVYTPKIFSDLFNQREISPYNLRRRPECRVPFTRTVHHASERDTQACPCRLCKNYIPGVGFVESLP